MKKALLTIAVALTGLFVACNKTTTSPNNNTTPAPAALKNEWDIKGKNYKSTVCLFPEPTVLAAFETMPSVSTPVNSVSVYFKNKPTADGSYKVVFKADIDSLAVDEVGIMVNVTANNAQYFAAGTDNVTAKVSVANGKVSFELPETLVFSVQPTNDTTTLKAQFTEQ